MCKVIKNIFTVEITPEDYHVFYLFSLLFNIISFLFRYRLCNMTPILSGGTTALEPIMTSLESTLTEFIPYVVYIGLGVLGAIIWFTAIRWLMNWTRAKVLGTFSSWRRRR